MKKSTEKRKRKTMELTHFDENGKARMVDVTDKQDTVREATAAGKITVSRTVYDAIEAGKAMVTDKLTGTIVKEIYVPGRIINIVCK